MPSNNRAGSEEVHKNILSFNLKYVFKITYPYNGVCIINRQI